MQDTEIREILNRMGVREIWLHVEDILESGVSIDELLVEYEPSESYLVSHLKELKDYGADPNILIKLYAKCKLSYLNSKDFPEIWDGIVYGMSPEYISPDDVIVHFPLKSIKKAFAGLKGVNYNGANIFVEEFAEAGGNLDLLGRIALINSGYTEDEESLAFLATIVNKGAKTIDPNRIIDALTYRAYSYNDPESIKKVNAFFLKELKDYADEAHLKKLQN